MKLPAGDKQLGLLRTLIAAFLGFAILYLAILLPWSNQSGQVEAAIATLALLLGGVLGLRPYGSK